MASEMSFHTFPCRSVIFLNDDVYVLVIKNVEDQLQLNLIQSLQLNQTKGYITLKEPYETDDWVANLLFTSWFHISILRARIAKDKEFKFASFRVHETSRKIVLMIEKGVDSVQEMTAWRFAWSSVQS